MSSSNNRPLNVLVVSGMHRSGTSVTSGWLANCGLFVGNRLMMGKVDNPSGHYEDLSFVDFHEGVLQDHGVGPLLPQHRDLPVSVERRELAVSLVAAREGFGQWGWKDPRTSLFLDFWHRLLPEAKFLFVARDCPPVVRSLLERDRHWHLEIDSRSDRNRLRKRLKFSFLNLGRVRYLSAVWTLYNRRIIDFSAQHKDIALTVSVEDLRGCWSNLVRFMNREWGFELEAVDFGSVYRPRNFNRDALPAASFLISRLNPEVKSTARELQSLRAETLERIA